MATFELPVRNDRPAYRFQMELEGQLYFFEFCFNTRAGNWIMDIQDQAQTDLIRGIPILVNISLLDGYTSEYLPPGSFVCLDLTGKNRDPDRTNFGGDLKLYYAEANA